jgi:hypothetical protein
MKIFLSYASENRKYAEEIAIALQGMGHRVFFDHTDLKGGEDYTSVIQDEISDADLFLFLITPFSVEPGSYALSELRMAREKWDHPQGHVIPVMIEPTKIESIPAYLKGVTFFQAEGNVAAELAAHIGKKRISKLWYAAGLILILFVAGMFTPRIKALFFPAPIVQQDLIDKDDFVTRYIFDSMMVEILDYTLDPNTSFPNGGRDVVRLDRLAFGTLGDSVGAWNLTISITNTSDQPITLDLNRRFFSLEDDLGRRGDMLYFCCPTEVDMISRDEVRRLHLIFKSHPEWIGKELRAKSINFKIQGLLPLVRGVWSWRPLATAD